MRFSIVIPLHRDSAVFRRTLDSCLGLRHEDFEVIVVSDRAVQLPSDERLRFLATGSETDTSPAEKRDAAMDHVTGEVIAFLDDDACPDPAWLTVAQLRFGDAEVVALGGPGVTPPGSVLRERVGGAVYESVLGSGPLLYRFTPRAPRVVDDYPAYNLFVRTDRVRAIGGWATTFYGGEDTHFCEALKAAGVLVHYEPDLWVFHSRRPIFRAHMRQVANVGLHRGYFARRRGTSRRWLYLLPTLVTAGVPLAVMTFGMVRPAATTVAVAAAYAAIGLASPRHELLVRALFPVALMAHHGSYGAGFLRGLFTQRLAR